jgi:ABC1 atypical kinase-like domain
MAGKQPKTIAALKRERTKRLATLGAKVYYMRKRGREQAMYDLICEEFVKLGGVYIKFLQGVLFSTTIMRRWHSPNKLKIFENVDREPINVVRILQNELTPDRLKQIALVQPEPFAAGSFGQVYLGQLADGQRIVVKVLRPMIRELLKYDLKLLTTFSKYFASREYTNYTVNMNSAIKEFRVATLNETDYVAEVQLANDLYDAYKDNPNLVIPKTYTELCTPHIIVQEYIDGISGAELLRVKDEGIDPAVYIREKVGSDLNTQLTFFGIECIMSAFDLPRMQGDPHPGNIRFLPNNKVGLIDFGISAPAPRNKPAFFGIVNEWSRIYHEKTDISGIFEQFVRFFVNDLYRALKKLSTLTASTPTLPEAMQQLPGLRTVADNSTDLVKNVGRLVQHMFDGATGTSELRDIMDEGQILRTFGEIVNKDNRLGLVVQLESSEIIRAAQTFVALLDALDRRGTLLPDILRQVVARVESEHPDIVHATERSVSMSQAIDIVNRWLERVAVRDPAMFTQLLKHIDRSKVKAASVQANAKEKTSDA